MTCVGLGLGHSLNVNTLLSIVQTDFNVYFVQGYVVTERDELGGLLSTHNACSVVQTSCDSCSGNMPMLREMQVLQLCTSACRACAYHPDCP